MQKSFIERHAGPAPRYTSYPTAPHFHAGIDAVTYAAWLKALEPGQTLSLYIHVPYCDRLCWFCACHTRQTLRYEPLAVYLEALKREIATVASLVDPGCRVTALHLGGGSPTLLEPRDMIALDRHLRAHFTFDRDAEISVEMDPNDLDDPRYDALAGIGVTRASIGVQDFDPKVQHAINREQTFEQTRGVVDAVRARGVRSVNCDVLYGLPFQTRDSVARTVDDIVSLSPDRVALFGYAHVPWMKTHQKMIDEAALPDVAERYAQMSGAAERLAASGYTAIGIDHFARPGDSLAIAAAAGRMRRNFQGYTDDGADALIGLGASSIGQLPQGYVQNVTATGEYQRIVNAGNLAVARGFALERDDRVRARVIELLMCDFAFDVADLRRQYGDDSDPVVADARAFAAADRDDLVEFSGSLFQVTARGRPFVRTIASAFDAYLTRGAARHSISV